MVHLEKGVVHLEKGVVHLEKGVVHLEKCAKPPRGGVNIPESHVRSQRQLVSFFCDRFAPDPMSLFLRLAKSGRLIQVSRDLEVADRP